MHTFSDIMLSVFDKEKTLQRIFIRNSKIMTAVEKHTMNKNMFFLTSFATFFSKNLPVTNINL